MLQERSLAVSASVLLIGIMMVAFKFNYRDLPILALQVEELGISVLGVERFVPVGRGRQWQAFALEASELRQLHTDILQLRAQLKTRIECNDPIFMARCCTMMGIELGQVGGILGGCSAGIEACYISSAGVLHPCTLLDMPVGNVMKSGFSKIWSEHPILQQLRNRANLKNRCGRCMHIAVCGGCRALVDDGLDGQAADPGCYLFKAIPIAH